MIMKRRCIVYFISIFVISILLVSVAYAECRPGKKAVTIVRGNSEVMELCVAEADIPYIGGESDRVIEASCPCFSPEQVKSALSNDHDACGYMFLGNIGGYRAPCGGIFVRADEKEFYVKSTCSIEEGYVLPGGFCKQTFKCLDNQEYTCLGPIGDCKDSPTHKELQACEAILMNLAWEPYE